MRFKVSGALFYNGSSIMSGQYISVNLNQHGYNTYNRDNTMGNSPSTTLLPLPSSYSILNYGYCKVWKHLSTHEQVYQQYDISIENTALAQYSSLFPLHNSDANLPTLHYFSLLPASSSQICSSMLQATLLLQRIPYRLSQFDSIPINDILLVYQSALHGYYGLYGVFGLFRVRGSMIGINNDGRVKVWCHTDYGNASPEDGGIYKVEDMVDSIIKCIQYSGAWEQQTERKYPPMSPNAYRSARNIQRLSNFVKCNPHLSLSTFHEAITAFNAYLSYYKLTVPQRLDHVTSYLRKIEGWEEMSYNQNFLANISGKNLVSTRGRNLGSSRDSSSSRGKFSFKDSQNNAKNIYTNQAKPSNSIGKYSMNTHAFQEQRQPSIQKGLTNPNVYYTNNAHQHHVNHQNQVNNQNTAQNQIPIPIQHRLSPLKFNEGAMQSQQCRAPVPLTIHKIHYVAQPNLKSSIGENVPSSPSKKSIYNSRSDAYSITNRGRQMNDRVEMTFKGSRFESSQASQLASSTSFMQDNEVRQKMKAAFTNKYKESLYYYGK